MNSLLDRLQWAYSLLVSVANSLQSPFLLVRAAVLGMAVCGQMAGASCTTFRKVIEFFTSLGLPAPAPTAYFVSDSGIGWRHLARARTGQPTDRADCLTGNMTVAYITG